MEKNVLETHCLVHDIALRYAELLMENRTVDFYTAEHEPEGSLHLCNWKSPENIETGASGVLLFLIELFRQTRDEKYAALINEEIQQLLTYCKSTSSVNYSFYTGRGGVIYLLLQFYEITRDEELLKGALELIGPANEEYLYSDYTSDYLYDGRAGTLLIIIYLYQVSGEKFLLEYINEFAEKIISNAQVNGNAIFWNSKGDVSLKASCGFAHGAAGIRFVFMYLRRYCSNPLLQHIIEGADKFISSCVVPELKNWGNFKKNILNRKILKEYEVAYLSGNPNIFKPTDELNWADGTAGILFSAFTRMDAGEVEMGVAKLKSSITQAVAEPATLYSGLAGLAVTIYEANLILKDGELEELLEELTEWLISESASPDIKGGLFHGKLGIAYFFLKKGNFCKGSENILAPLLNSGKESPVPELDLTVSLNAMRRHFLFRIYPRTIYVAEGIDAEAVKMYFKTSGFDYFGHDIRCFEEFIEKQCKANAGAGNYKRLADVFSLEKTKHEFFISEKRTLLEIYLDRRHCHNKAMKVLAGAEEWFMNQSFSFSGDIKIAESQWDWSFDDEYSQLEIAPTKKRYLKNMEKQPAKFTYVIQVDGNGKLSENLFRADLVLLCEFFKEPKPVSQVFDEVRLYIQALSRDVLSQMLSRDGEVNTTDAGSELVMSIIEGNIREWIHRGILVIHEQCPLVC
jgi:Lanthionine synthetase C-like protein